MKNPDNALINWALKSSKTLHINLHTGCHPHGASYAVLYHKDEPTVLYLVRNGQPIAPEARALLLEAFFAEHISAPRSPEVA
jgi:hypothetical protein